MVDDPIVQESTPDHHNSGRVAELFLNLQLWQLVTLQPVDLQYLFRKIQAFLSYILSIQGTSKIFNVVFFQSKWPYLLHKMGYVYSQSLRTVFRDRKFRISQFYFLVDEIFKFLLPLLKKLQIKF